MRPRLVIGAPHVVRYTVPVHQTVPNLLPALAEFRRGQPIFATGFMVGLMEAPCMAAVHPHLEPGEATVGTLINMTHVAASPPGTSLVAEARAIAIEGRSVRFAVVVADADGEIVAAGEHGLRVIEVVRFRDRLAAKQAQFGRLGSSELSCEHQRRGEQPPHLPTMTRLDAGTHIAQPSRDAGHALDHNSPAGNRQPRHCAQRARGPQLSASATANATASHT